MSKVILITGTNSGFGAHTARLLALNGYKVYATMRDIDGRNKVAALALTTEFKNITVLELELTNTESILNAVQFIMEKEQCIDVLINNAGQFYMGIGETFTEQDLMHIYDVDVLGPWRLIRTVLPHMRKQNSGYIITVTSSLARFSCPYMTAYASAKHALEGLLHGIKYELKNFNIDISFIEPGIFPTNIFNRYEHGSDDAVNAQYGPYSYIDKTIKEQLDTLFSTPHANDPKRVALSILNLLSDTSIERPIRLVVDPNAGVITHRMNLEHEKEYTNFLNASGMSNLL